MQNEQVTADSVLSLQILYTSGAISKDEYHRRKKEIDEAQQNDLESRLQALGMLAE